VPKGKAFLDHQYPVESASAARFAEDESKAEGAALYWDSHASVPCCLAMRRERPQSESGCEASEQI